MYTLVTIAPEGSWSLGVLVGIPVLALVVLGLVALTAFLFWFWREDGDGMLAFFGGMSAALTAAVVALALAPTGYYPYKGEYHQWRAVSGVVQEVGNRLLTSDSGIEQKIVVRYVGSDLAFGCQDTRCALVKPGDTLDLKCKRAWQYQSESGYDCRFVARKGK